MSICQNKNHGFYDDDEPECPLCKQRWEEWKKEEAENLARIKDLRKQGHTKHCSCRMIWGDGECECGMLDHE
jgi:hypothetical protein